jgi:hypothetical protein
LKGFVWPEVRIDDVAHILGLSRARIRQFIDEGVIVQSSPARYELDRAVLAYVNWQRDDNRKHTKSAGASAVSMARTQMIELQMAEKTGELQKAAVDEALSAVTRVIGAMKADCYSVPARVTLDLKLRKKIEGEIDRVFAASATRTENIRKSAGTSGAATEAGGEAIPRRVGRPKQVIRHDVRAAGSA